MASNLLPFDKVIFMYDEHVYSFFVKSQQTSKHVEVFYVCRTRTEALEKQIV